MNIGIDHGYYAIKTKHHSFPAGITAYGEQEPYTRQNLLVFEGRHYICGTGRQPIQRDKTASDNYYLLTLVALAQELRTRGAPRECSVTIAAGLPLTGFGRDNRKRHTGLRCAGGAASTGHPLRTAEMILKDVYGMIDGVINDGKRCEKVEKAKEIAEMSDSEKKNSFESRWRTQGGNVRSASPQRKDAPTVRPRSTAFYDQK